MWLWWYHVTLWWHLKKRFGLLDVWLKLNETVKNLTFKRPLCQSHPNVADSKKLSLNLKLVFVRSCNWFLIKTQYRNRSLIQTRFFELQKIKEPYFSIEKYLLALVSVSRFRSNDSFRNVWWVRQEVRANLTYAFFLSLRFNNHASLKRLQA